MAWTGSARRSAVLCSAVTLLFSATLPAAAAPTAAALSASQAAAARFPSAPFPAKPEIPSPEDIASAKASESATADEVARIDRILAATAAEQNVTAAASMRANNAYGDALVELRARQETASLASAKARAAGTEQQNTRKQVGQIAADLYRNGGLSPALSTVLSGSGESLQQAATLEAISADRSRAFESAETAAAAAESLTAAAEEANKAAEDAARTAEDRKSEADHANAALLKSIADAKDQRSVLVSQLASLKNTTEALESARVEAMERQRQQELLAAITTASQRHAAGSPTEEAPPPAAPPGPNPGPAPVPTPGNPPSAAPVPAPAPPPAPAPGPAPAPAPPAPAPAPPPAPVPGGSNQAAISAALGKVGAPYFYEYGGTGPYGFDCSGFVQNSFAAAGKYLPRTATQQFAQAPGRVPLAQAQPGDLLVWGSPSDFSHVAIYLGNGQVVQSLNPQAGIEVTPLSWMAGMQLYPYAARY